MCVFEDDVEEERWCGDLAWRWLERCDDGVAEDAHPGWIFRYVRSSTDAARARREYRVFALRSLIMVVICM